MPPKVKFSKEEIVDVALKIVRRKGIDAITARELAKALGLSTRPIFTWFDSMDELKLEVYRFAKEIYKVYIENGLSQEIPFLGVGKQCLRFAKEEPEFYKLLFLTRPGNVSEGAMESLVFSQDLARESLMKIYRMDADTADRYFRDLWLVVFSFATLIVTDESPYTEEEMSSILTKENSIGMRSSGNS